MSDLTPPLTLAGPDAVPRSAGVGLKPAHYRTILEQGPDMGWFEIHAENYMGAGGPPHRYLTAIRERYPLSVHGVGLSIGGARALDRRHLSRLADLVRRYRPGLFSEHLAWSTHSSGFLNDLLPLPYTDETLNRVCRHIDQVQEVLGQRLLLENPSTYVHLADSTISEVQFLDAVSHRTGCGLLLDVNNVQVCATNHGFEAQAYLDAFPMNRVTEIHVAGHDQQQDDEGRPLLIDTHDRPATDGVWQLLEHTLTLTGPLPVLIEWDNDIPSWSALFDESRRAQRLLDRHIQHPEAGHALAS
ncbi:MNIO family bufferin maturase [Ectothiorhodospira lacustris]|uniref:MNIO family bufferin maturase n=1 Tax=Ectothiorhodospira lacustris TaxID=2899127 RepID=UPI001EE99075|nr:DUF692 domain-containing protein [Ectothiorhodospira lacustris]MCG5501944.1 DUF692 domain-containing protein [Ectothiorhodospira lacustris]MCG5511432.1 DUF692 domain-containing protein [Ectothiorhodospira lacustris]MCG5523167.1 DUF692 domain-containing protein [Ectothiorhodospira lacustris]